MTDGGTTAMRLPIRSTATERTCSACALESLLESRVGRSHQSLKRVYPLDV